MKSNKDFQKSGGDDLFRKTPKLDPIRKSGKERHSLYKSMDEDEDDDLELVTLHRRESVLDYMDDDVDDE